MPLVKCIIGTGKSKVATVSTSSLVLTWMGKENIYRSNKQESQNLKNKISQTIWSICVSLTIINEIMQQFQRTSKGFLLAFESFTL